MQKAIFLTNVPAPYRVAQMNHAARHLAQHDVELKVLFEAATYGRRAYWQGSLDDAAFAYRLLKDTNVQIGSEKLLTLGWSLPAVLREEAPDAIVAAGYSLPAVMAAVFARRQKIPYLIHSGETKRQLQTRQMEWLRRPVRNWLLGGSSGCIAYGTEAGEFLGAAGVRKDRIFTAINCVDTEAFQARLSGLKKSAAKGTPAKMLYLGNLQEQKGLHFVLEALDHLRREHDLPVAFEIVGDGPDRSRLESLVDNLGLSDVHFHGAVPYKDVVSFYVDSAFFVFPSLYDIYGLVMVEAAAAGLPIIASKYAGGSVDIVDDGVNGYVIDPKDIEMLANRILKLATDTDHRRQLAGAAKDKIKREINIETSGKGFAEAVLSVLPGTNRATAKGSQSAFVPTSESAPVGREA